MNSLIYEVISLALSPETEIKNIVIKSGCEVDLKILHQDDARIIKVLNIDGIKEMKILTFYENYSMIINRSRSFTFPFKTYKLNNHSEYIILSRDYYMRDLEETIYSKSFTRSDIFKVIYSMCDVVIMLNKYDMVIGNLKSSNVIYDSKNNLKVCDVFMDLLRKEEDLRVYDICFKSPEEMNGSECDERSVIWSIGCILYEMIYKKLPFNEDDNMNKNKRKYSEM